MSKFYFSPLVFCIVVFSCNQTRVSKEEHDTDKLAIPIDKNYHSTYTLIDTSKIAILAIDSSNLWISKNAIAFQLTSQDLLIIDSLLTDCISINNKKQDTTKRLSEYINLKNYKRQYIPFIDSTAKKKIYINCFCIPDYADEFDYWKKSLVEVEEEAVFFI